MLFASRKKAIESLHQTISQQAGLLQAIERSMAVIEFDVNGTVLRANESFLRTLGYRADQVVGQHHRIFCTPDYARSTEYSGFWLQMRSGAFASSTFERVTADGRSVWLEATYNPVADEAGKIVRVIKFAVDVTKRVQEENEARSKLGAIDRAMACIEFDLSGHILFANSNFLKLMGYRLEEIQGRHHSLFCAPELKGSKEYSDFWRRLNAGEFTQGQFKRVGKQGQMLWLEASYNPMYDASGKLYKVIKFASDITRRVEKYDLDAHSASQAYHISVETRRAAEQGTQVIQEAANEMRQIALNIDESSKIIAQLGERSQQITAIVNTIRGIADQTNLLALNAAIEAARAGDQGRGFSVVADEVRQLAGRTSGSTAEISAMIEKIQEETRQAIVSMDSTRSKAGKGVALADQAGEVIVQIRDGASEAVDAVSMFAGHIV